jgi:hypothetical protein
MKHLLAVCLLRAGMALLDRQTRDLVRDIIMYHVPGALSAERKQAVQDAAAAARLKLGRNRQ